MESAFPGALGVVRHPTGARAWVMPALVGMLAISACSTSSSTLAMQPDFALTTPSGVASVSIRQSPPALTDAEFKRLIVQGMQSAMPGSGTNGSLNAPYPTRRIVWHVEPMPRSGESRVVVNAFDGAEPFAYQEQVIDNSAPTIVLKSAITSMTRRLAAALGEHSRDDCQSFSQRSTTVLSHKLMLCWPA